MAEPDCIAPVLDYLTQGTLPANTTEAQCLAHHAKAYILVGTTSTRGAHRGFLQKCIPREQGRQMLREIHGGVCRH
jgi:hypothetical protein